MEYDEVATGYVNAVLSYAPVVKWRQITGFVEDESNSTKITNLHKILAADSCYNMHERERARDILKTVSNEDEIKNSIVKLMYKGLSAWIIHNNTQEAFEYLTEALEQDKTNLFLCKRAQLMALLGGFNDKILVPAKMIEEENTGRHYFAGMLVFGYEQANMYKEAEKAALIGIQANEKDGWLDHGYAHSLYFQGESRINDAKKYLETKAPSWSLEKMMPFLYTHLWWHYSLVLLESGHVNEAIEVFDTRLWPDGEDVLVQDVQVQINALELLWKLETLGCTVETIPRWKKVVDVAKTRIGRNDDLLHDILLLRGCSVVNYEKEIKDLGASIKELGNPDFEELFTTCLKIFQGNNEKEQAREKLKSLKDKWHVVGNSTEQRAVFLELAYDSPVVCGRPRLD